MSTLTGKTVASSYKDLLQISNNNIGVDTSVRYIEDGEGTPSVLGISTSIVEVAGPIIPDINLSRDLGNTTRRFRDLYLSGNTIHLGDEQINVGDIHTIRDVQNGAYATAAQGAKADTALQPGDTISFIGLSDTPTTLAGYGITDAATTSYVDDKIFNEKQSLEWVNINNTPTTLAGYGITNAATAAQGAKADTALQPGDNINYDSLTDRPTTLAGYGITDAATAAQGAKADTALQPTNSLDFNRVINTPNTLAGYGIDDGATKTYVDNAVIAGQGSTDWSNITNTPNTLAGYGITDAATSAQGFLADSALQPGATIPFTDISNTPTTLAGYGITDAATTSYVDTQLSNFSGSSDWSDISNTPTTLAGYGIVDAFDGSWNSLTDAPTLFSGSYNDLTDTPTLFSGSYNDLTDKPGLFSGSYNDLIDTPTLFSGSYNDLTDKPVLFSGSWNDLTDTPTTVAGYGITDAFDGSWNNLTDTPTTVAGYGITDAVTQNTDVTFNDVTVNSIMGGSTLVIDPAAIGDDTGVVRIRGDLQIDGTTTAINSTTLNVSGLQLVLAQGATSTSEADGAGITINGSSASITYQSSTDSWIFNKSIDIGTYDIKWSGSGNQIKNLNGLTFNVSDTDVFSVGSSDISPVANMAVNLGSESYHWMNIYSHNYWVHNNITFADNNTIDSDDVVNWNDTRTTVQNNSAGWESGGSGTGGSGLQSRTQVTYTASSVPSQQSVDVDLLNTAKSYFLQKISTSTGAWVAVYTDSQSRTNDSSRNILTDPTPGTGVIAEVVTSGQADQLITPGIIGFNDDLSPTDTMYIKIFNNTDTTSDITITITYVQLES